MKAKWIHKQTNIPYNPGYTLKTRARPWMNLKTFPA